MFALHVRRLYIIPIIAKLIAATGFYLFTGFRGVINRTPSSDKHHSVVTWLMSYRLTRTGDDRKQVQQVQDLVCTVTTSSKSTCTPRSTVHADHGWFSGADPGGGPRGPGPPPDPRFWGPKIEHFWALFNFSLIFFASLCSAYYFFNMLLFQSSNSKIFQPRFARHMISHLEVFVFSLSFTHFRLLGVHLSLSFF